MYHEPQTSRLHGVALAALVVLIALPPALLLELPESLAVEALSGREAMATGSWWPLQLFGQPAAVEPGAPWVFAVAASLGLSNDLGVRLVSMVCVLLLAVLNGAMAMARSRQLAGLVTAAALLTCLGGIRMVSGSLDWILFALMINAAWYVWFEFGRERKSWLFAWCFAYLLVGISLLIVGGKALIYFYLPLFFLRRPLRVWRRFGHWDHWVGFLALAGVVGIWVLALSGGRAELGVLLPEFVDGQGVQSYLGRLFWIPIVVVFGFFPWVGLVWPGFCAAFRPLEAQPVFCSFLRTICISLFFFVWIVPVDDAGKALLPLVGPAAVLLSRNYTLLVRRHGKALQRVSRLLAVSALGGAGAALVLAVAFGSGFADFVLGQGLPKMAVYLMLGVAGAGAVLAAGLVWGRGQRPVWLSVALSMGALHLTLFAAIGIPVDSHYTAGRYRESGPVIARVVPEGTAIYWYGGESRSAAAAWYLEHPVIVVEEELPREVRDIYVMTPGRKPSDAHWQWEPIGDSWALGRDRVRIWRGMHQ